MSYKDEYHPKVKSNLKKLDKGVVRKIYDIHLDNILHEPYSGGELHGDWRAFQATISERIKLITE